MVKKELFLNKNGKELLIELQKRIQRAIPTPEGMELEVIEIKFKTKTIRR